MLETFTVLVMAAVAYVYLTEGLFTACLMCCNVLAAGLVAFNFWEPIADWLDTVFAGSFLHGYEDALCLILLFALALGLLRLATNSLAPAEIEYHPLLQRAGGAVFGLVTGYLVCGFLLCVFQTLPWHENFMYFDPKYDADRPLRRVLPPDRAWLALMHRAGAFAFSSATDPAVPEPDSLYEKYLTFDKYATFEIRYARYRRYNDQREALPYDGAFNRELHRVSVPGRGR